MDCLFCKIVKGEIPSKKVYEDKDVLAFEDINPQAPVHVLIIPKEHINSLAEIDKKRGLIIQKIFLIVNQIARDKGILERGYRVVSNCNDEGGQLIFHLHFHLLGGRKLGDSLVG